MTIQDSIIQALQASHEAHQSGLAALVASQTAHQNALAEIDVLWQDKAELEATIADLQSRIADLEAKVAHLESESVKIVEPDTVNPLLDWLSRAVAATHSAIVPMAPAKEAPPAAVLAEPPPPEAPIVPVPPAPEASAPAEPPPPAPEVLVLESAAHTAPVEAGPTPAPVHDAPVHLAPEPETTTAPVQEVAASEPSVIKVFASEAFAAISLKDEPPAKPVPELVHEPAPEQKSA